MATKTNVTGYHQGTDISFPVTVLDDAGAVVDLSGLTEINWILCRSATDARFKIEKALTGSGIELTDAPNGIFTVSLADTETTDLVGRYYWEAQITDTAGAKTLVAYGTLEILPKAIA